MISFYDVFMYPLETRGIKKARMLLVPKTSGRILEIGSGTGVNIKHYNFENITGLTLSDQTISKKLKERSDDKIELMELDVEKLPFSDNTFDYVVHTLVFCSVVDINKGLSEIARVLKPGGKLMFIEHVLPEKKRIRKFFNFINPLWTKFASGCNLNRDYETSLTNKDFKLIYSKRFMNTVFIYGEAELKTL